MQNILSKLGLIQASLKSHKGQFNKFGNYRYRSCEDILEALKPLLAGHGCVLTISDSIEQIADRFYVKATSTITCTEDGSSHHVSAFAREEFSKKGMDSSQLTGSTSSYARKYSLNGLFCIDDTQDADSQDNSQHNTEVEKPWFNEKDWESKRDSMYQQFFTQKMTGEQAVQHLRKTYKVSRDMADSIEALYQEAMYEHNQATEQG